LAACNADQEYQDAMPTASEVAVPVPAAHGQTLTSSSDGIGVQSSALLGTTSQLYQITYDVSSGINGSTAALLGMLRLVTLNPATSRTSDSRTWGPYTPGGLDPMSYQLIVNKLGTQHYGFSLQASSRLATDPSAFLPLIDGEITPGSHADTAHGTMQMHFDNRRLLMPDACEDGTIAFDFDNTSNPVRNDVSLHAFANANAKNLLCNHDLPADAAYHFDQDTAGAGNFVFTTETDMVKPAGQTAPSNEHVAIRSRWNATGAGRSDIIISGSDVDTTLAAGELTGPVTGSQCWGTSFQTVFESSSPVQLHVFDSDGQTSDCVYTSAELPQ
jgi:hypothetical protein